MAIEAHLSLLINIIRKTICGKNLVKIDFSYRRRKLRNIPLNTLNKITSFATDNYIHKSQ